MRTDIKYLTVLFETENGDASIYVDKKEVKSMMPLAQRTSDPEALKDKDSDEIETEEVQFTNNLTTRIIQNLLENTKNQLVNLLQINKDFFAYTLSDMPGVDPSIAQHSLNVDPNIKPIKQKK